MKGVVEDEVVVDPLKILNKFGSLYIDRLNLENIKDQILSLKDTDDDDDDKDEQEHDINVLGGFDIALQLVYTSFMDMALQQNQRTKDETGKTLKQQHPSSSQLFSQFTPTSSLSLSRRRRREKRSNSPQLLNTNNTTLLVDRTTHDHENFQDHIGDDSFIPETPEIDKKIFSAPTLDSNCNTNTKLEFSPRAIPETAVPDYERVTSPVFYSSNITNTSLDVSICPSSSLSSPTDAQLKSIKCHSTSPPPPSSLKRQLKLISNNKLSSSHKSLNKKVKSLRRNKKVSDDDDTILDITEKENIKTIGNINEEGTSPSIIKSKNLICAKEKLDVQVGDDDFISMEKTSSSNLNLGSMPTIDPHADFKNNISINPKPTKTSFKQADNRWGLEVEKITKSQLAIIKAKERNMKQGRLEQFMIKKSEISTDSKIRLPSIEAYEKDLKKAMEASLKDYDSLPGVSKEDDIGKGRSARRLLEAVDCNECREFYSGTNLSNDQLKKLIQNCSRHRTKDIPSNATSDSPQEWMNFEISDNDIANKTQEGPPLKKRKRPDVYSRNNKT